MWICFHVVTAGILVILGILIAIFVVLLRRGHMKPVRRGLNALSVRYRKSVYGFRSRATPNQYTTVSDHYRNLSVVSWPNVIMFHVSPKINVKYIHGD